jgi:hypothetical protein
MKATIVASENYQQPLLINYGQIADIPWLGTVSAKVMLSKKFTTNHTINEATKRLNEFYVSAKPTAKTRCIDGRYDPLFDEAELGPQLPGGAPGAAIAYRLGVDKDDLTRSTFLTDAETMIGNFIRLGLTPGGHRDEHSDSNKVGCGAIDGMDAILAAMTNPSLVDDHKRVVKMLLGDEFDRESYLRIMGASVLVNGRSEEYFRNRKTVIDILEKRAKNSVAILHGSHSECIIVVNTIPNTTLASNRFAEMFNGTQAFGYDIWYSKQIATLLMPRPDQITDRLRFITARVMYVVATLMVLTDGSQRIIVRVPQPTV